MLETTDIALLQVPELAKFLQPIGGDQPAGENLRYAPVYGQIKEARHEDDPSLPLGDWERPLKKADWRAVERWCEQALVERSKDLQIASWLTESWVRQRGIPGLTAGACLLQGLLQQFWESIHPAIDEDGDLEPRAAPLDWVNTQLEQILLLYVPLYPFVDKSPAFISLNDWQHAMAAEFGSASEMDVDGVITRDRLLEEALLHLASLAQLDSDIGAAQKAWTALAQELDAKFGQAAPSVSRITGMLSKMQQAIRSLLQNRDPRLQPALAPVQLSAPQMESPMLHGTSVEERLTAVAPAVGVQDVAVDGGQIRSREQAYQLLEMVAQYLESSEPHSPTPYLIKRAVTWGRLSLPELMQEVLREEGDLNRYFSMLGLKGE